MTQVKNIAVFASGSGSNAESIFNYFQDHESVEVKLLLSNKPDAFVLERAKHFSIPTHLFGRADFYDSNEVLTILEQYKIDWIVLAGFLWLIPVKMVKKYPNRILNIHPALLPKYGGKGMYGIHVHRAVVSAGEKESGMTIHFVNEKYDDGNIIFKGKCELDKNDSPEEVASKVLALEHEHFAKIIEIDVLKLQNS